MNRLLFFVGFVVLFAGGLVYTIVPYTTTSYQKVVSENDDFERTTISTQTGNNPLGIVMMLIGLAVVTVGLSEKSQAVRCTREVSDEK